MMLNCVLHWGLNPFWLKLLVARLLLSNCKSSLTNSSKILIMLLVVTMGLMSFNVGMSCCFASLLKQISLPIVLWLGMVWSLKMLAMIEERPVSIFWYNSSLLFLSSRICFMNFPDYKSHDVALSNGSWSILCSIMSLLTGYVILSIFGLGVDWFEYRDLKCWDKWLEISSGLETMIIFWELFVIFSLFIKGELLYFILVILCISW